MSEERDVIAAGHSYDGIQEYDNPMPRWWVWIFIGTAVYSLFYFVHFQLGHGDSVEEAYAAEMKRFDAAEAERMANLGEVNQETLEKMSENSAMLAAGESAYQTHCASCHEATGGGSIGPNLTDEHWIHGDGTLMAIYQTVSNGVVAKGMPAWNRTLTPNDLRAVVAYVGAKLVGKDVEGGKEPQGEIPERLEGN